MPAAPDAWITALRRYGTMSFGDVAAAAIRLARDGFPMYPLMAASLKRHEADHRAWPSTAAIFLPNGRPPEAGEVFRQTDLAASLQYMADEERAAASRGREAGSRSGPRRLLSRRHRPQDRRLHEAGGRASVGRRPRRIPLAGRRRRSAAALAISKSSPAAPGARGRSCCKPWHCSRGLISPASGRTARTTSTMLAEALKLAFADREAYYGDPAKVEVPLATLISSEYAAERRKLIRPDRAIARDAAAGRSRPGGRPLPREPRRSQPRARHLLCLRRRPLRQSVLGDPERRLLRFAGGARDRAHPVQPRLAVAPRPAPSRRGRARQAAAPDAKPGAGDQGAGPVPAVRHAGRRCADPGDAAGAAQPVRLRAGRADRRSKRRALRPTASRRPSRRSIIIPAGSPSKAASPSRSSPNWRGAATRSSAGPTGSGPPARSARSSPTAAAASSKPAPTRAAPPTRSVGN